MLRGRRSQAPAETNFEDHEDLHLEEMGCARATRRVIRQAKYAHCSAENLWNRQTHLDTDGKDDSRKSNCFAFHVSTVSVKTVDVDVKKEKQVQTIPDVNLSWRQKR